VVTPGTRSVAASANAKQGAATSANAIDWDAAGTLERLGGDETLLREVIRIFLEDNTGHLAGLRRAIKESDLNAIEKIAHSLKGELAYFGISSLCDNARELERMGKERDLRHAAQLFAIFETDIATVVRAMRETNDTRPDKQPVAERHPVP
jgi:HPt (histidine-containing phosphotransfer) domain-containing protein